MRMPQARYDASKAIASGPGAFARRAAFAASSASANTRGPWSTSFAATRSPARRAYSRALSASSSSEPCRHASSSTARTGGSTFPHSGIAPA